MRRGNQNNPLSLSCCVLALTILINAKTAALLIRHLCTAAFDSYHQAVRHKIMNTSQLKALHRTFPLSMHPCPVCGRTKDTDRRISRDGKMVRHQNFDHINSSALTCGTFDKPSSDDGRCGVRLWRKAQSIQPTARRRAKKKEKISQHQSSGAKLQVARTRKKPLNDDRSISRQVSPTTPHDHLQLQHQSKSLSARNTDATNPKARRQITAKFTPQRQAKFGN